MTEIERLMLSICFGATVGFIIAPWVLMIKDAILSHREKKRKAKETGDQ